MCARVFEIILGRERERIDGLARARAAKGVEKMKFFDLTSSYFSSNVPEERGIEMGAQDAMIKKVAEEKKMGGGKDAKNRSIRSMR